jgi:hypothetical protein
MQEKETTLEAELCIEFDGPKRVPVDPEAQYTKLVAIWRAHWMIRRSNKDLRYELLKEAITQDGLIMWRLRILYYGLYDGSFEVPWLTASIDQPDSCKTARRKMWRKRTTSLASSTKLHIRWMVQISSLAGARCPRGRCPRMG